MTRYFSYLLLAGVFQPIEADAATIVADYTFQNGRFQETKYGYNLTTPFEVSAQFNGPGGGQYIGQASVSEFSLSTYKMAVSLDLSDYTGRSFGDEKVMYSAVEVGIQTKDKFLLPNVTPGKKVQLRFEFNVDGVQSSSSGILAPYLCGIAAVNQLGGRAPCIAPPGTLSITSNVFAAKAINDLSMRVFAGVLPLDRFIPSTSVYSGRAAVDLSHTIRLLNVGVLDQVGQVITGARLVSASGAAYPGTVLTPEPGGLPCLLAAGAAAALCRKHLRSR